MLPFFFYLTIHIYLPFALVWVRVLDIIFTVSFSCTCRTIHLDNMIRSPLFIYNNVHDHLEMHQFKMIIFLEQLNYVLPGVSLYVNM
jgi:hypothetical protein